jgi:hypothetical protein
VIGFREPDRSTPERQRQQRAAFVNKRTQSLGSVGPFLMEMNGRYRAFEFHGVCGPLLVDKNGESLARQPGASSDFWPLFDAWSKAGCHVDQHNRAFVPSARIMSGATPPKGERHG